MNDFKVTFSSSAFNPTIALQGLDSAVNALATQIILNGTRGEIAEHDLPLYISGYNGEGKFFCTYQFALIHADDDTYSDINIPNPRFSIGDFVRHRDSGRYLTVDATVYLHGKHTHYYVTTYCPPKGVSTTLQYAQDELMSIHQFELLNYDLNQATGKIWHLDQEIEFFVNTSNKARKMRMSDARHAINTHVTGEEAPF